MTHSPGMAMPARLISPSSSGYLLLAATVERRSPLLPNSGRKRRVLAGLADDVAGLARRNSVRQAQVYDARLVAPGMGRALLRRQGVTPARFDVVVLIETQCPEDALMLIDDDGYRRMKSRLAAVSSRTYEVAARNVRRIAAVDHDADAVFLFNFFYASDVQRLLSVWEDTSGWFVANTSLPNSTVLQPLPRQPTEYGIINHASWPRLRTFLPHLILRPSFRRFVLATFAANNVAAQPILYRRIVPATSPTLVT